MSFLRAELKPAAEASDRLYRLIADTIPHMVWTARADGWLDFFNGRVHEYTGLDSRRLEGWGWKAVVHADDWDQCLATWTRALQSGERYEIEFRLLRADGAYRWHHGTAVPMRDADGHVARWFGTCTDIEDQMRSAQILESMVQQRTAALRESERRFETFMQNTPTLAWIKDADLRYTYVSKPYEKAFGCSLAQVLGKEDYELCATEQARVRRHLDEQVLRERSAVQTLRSMPDASGNERHWIIVKFPLADASGRMGVGGIAFDVTDRHRLESALSESELRFRTFMDNMPALVTIKDSRFRYVYVNRSYEAMRGRTLEAVLGRDDFALWPEDLARAYRDSDVAALSTNAVVQAVTSAPYADGRLGQWLMSKFRFKDANGESAVASVGVDVTDRIEAEERARDSAARVRELLGRLVQAQEAERRRVADELHDLIGQNLTALGIDLGTLRSALPAEGSAAHARLESMSALLEETIASIRGVMTELRPPALEEYGLVPALRWYVAVFAKRTLLQTSFTLRGPECRLPRETEMALFRIAQEALTNAAKHSGGKEVCVALEVQERAIRLTVEDDGRGFADPVGARKAQRGGWGLPAMRERAEAHRGVLHIEFPPRGSRVVVEIPRAQ